MGKPLFILRRKIFWGIMTLLNYYHKKQKQIIFLYLCCIFYVS